MWEESTNFIPLYPRTQYGNHAHRLAMQIDLLRNVFGASMSDPRVIQASFGILEFAKEMLSWFGRFTW